jgi:hypothetical protein
VYAHVHWSWNTRTPFHVRSKHSDKFVFVSTGSCNISAVFAVKRDSKAHTPIKQFSCKKSCFHWINANKSSNFIREMEPPIKNSNTLKSVKPMYKQVRKRWLKWGRDNLDQKTMCTYEIFEKFGGRVETGWSEHLIWTECWVNLAILDRQVVPDQDRVEKTDELE